MQQIAKSLAFCTNLWREGNSLILSFLDYRWYQSKNITDEEVHLATTVIGDAKTPQDPWHHLLQNQVIVCDLFRLPGSHVIMVLRIVSTPTLCVYVPSVAQLRISESVLGKAYYGRTSYAAWLNGAAIHSIDLVIRRDDLDYSIWLTEPHSTDFSHSFADILGIHVKPYMAECVVSNRRGLTNEVRAMCNACTVEWFITN